MFNQLNQSVALKLPPGKVADTKAVPSLTHTLVGKLCGDQGYIGQELAGQLWRRNLMLFTRVGKNMKARPRSMTDKRLLNARSRAATIIGHIKAFALLNLPKNTALR